MPTFPFSLVSSLSGHQDVNSAYHKSHSANVSDFHVESKTASVVSLRKPSPRGGVRIVAQVSASTLSVRENLVLLTLEEAAHLSPTTPEEMWRIVQDSSSRKFINLKPTTSRKGWKTIRLFVSSTFKDFHQEREVLVREVCVNSC